MPVSIDYSKCKICANCFNVCPQNVYDKIDDKPKPTRIDDCIECGLCISECPTQAIKWIEYQAPA